MILTREERPGSLDLALSAMAIVIGLPGSIGLAAGLPPADWPIPFGLQLLGVFALRTVVYLSGFSLAFGAIGFATIAGSWFDRSASRGGFDRSRDTRGDREESASEERLPSHGDNVSLAEPFYGFLPRAAQLRLARETGYQPLLFTKISILISFAVGVLLAGSWEIVNGSEPLPPSAALWIVVGLFLVAESAHRLIQLSHGRPMGTLVGTLLHEVVAPFVRRSRSAS